jgi:hypothetical protein
MEINVIVKYFLPDMHYPAIGLYHTPDFTGRWKYSNGNLSFEIKVKTVVTTKRLFRKDKVVATYKNIWIPEEDFFIEEIYTCDK